MVLIKIFYLIIKLKNTYIIFKYIYYDNFNEFLQNTFNNPSLTLMFTHAQILNQYLYLNSYQNECILFKNYNNILFKDENNNVIEQLISKHNKKWNNDEIEQIILRSDKKGTTDSQFIHHISNGNIKIESNEILPIKNFNGGGYY